MQTYSNAIRSCITFALLIICLHSNAQKLFIGPGFGLDYGVLGLKGDLQLHQNLSVFGSLGYNFDDVRANAGLAARFPTQKNIQPVILGMYGINALVKVKNEPNRTRQYYGFTTGIGVEIMERKGNKLSTYLLIPFRDQQAHDYVNELKSYGYTFNPGFLPITYSIGYNIVIFGRNKYNKTF